MNKFACFFHQRRMVAYNSYASSVGRTNHLHVNNFFSKNKQNYHIDHKAKCFSPKKITEDDLKKPKKIDPGSNGWDETTSHWFLGGKG